MSVEGLSPRGRQLAGAIAKNLELVQEHAKQHPNEALVLALFLIAHVRNTWPQALVALQNGPARVTAIAEATGTKWSTAAAIVKTLAERGLVSINGVRGAMRQTPKTYTYELTSAGRAAVSAGAA